MPWNEDRCLFLPLLWNKGRPLYLGTMNTSLYIEVQKVHLVCISFWAGEWADISIYVSIYLSIYLYEMCFIRMSMWCAERNTQGMQHCAQCCNCSGCCHSTHWSSSAMAASPTDAGILVLPGLPVMLRLLPLLLTVVKLLGLLLQSGLICSCGFDWAILHCVILGANCL